MWSKFDPTAYGCHGNKILLSAFMLSHAVKDLENYIRYRLDGSLFDLRRFHAKTKCEFVIEALFSYGAQ